MTSTNEADATLSSADVDSNNNFQVSSRPYIQRSRAKTSPSPASSSSTATKVADLSVRLDDTLLFFCPQFQSVVIGELANGHDPVAVRDVYMVSNYTLFDTCDIVALQTRPTVQSLALVGENGRRDRAGSSRSSSASLIDDQQQRRSIFDPSAYDTISNSSPSSSAAVDNKRLVFQCRPGDELKKPITLRRFSPLPKSIDFECGQFYYFIGVPDSQIVSELTSRQQQRRNNSKRHSQRQRRGYSSSTLCDDLKVLRLRIWISCSGEGPPHPPEETLVDAPPSSSSSNDNAARTSINKQRGSGNTKSERWRLLPAPPPSSSLSSSAFDENVQELNNMWFKSQLRTLSSSSSVVDDENESDEDDYRDAAAAAATSQSLVSLLAITFLSISLGMTTKIMVVSVPV